MSSVYCHQHYSKLESEDKGGKIHPCCQLSEDNLENNLAHLLYMGFSLSFAFLSFFFQEGRLEKYAMLSGMAYIFMFY